MKTARLSAALITNFVTLLAVSAASQNCWAVIVYFDGGPTGLGAAFLDATNWNPDGVPGNNLVDIYSIDDGFSSTLSGGTTTVKGLRVGSVAKEHQFGDTHFGRLTMAGATLEVIGSNALAIGRERENALVGADYNKNSVVDTADYALWRDTLGSTSNLSADGDHNGTIEQADYVIWKSQFGKVVKGGEIIMTGSSTLTANGALIGERTKALLSVGPNAIVDIRIWDTTVTPNQFGGAEDIRIGGYGPAYDDFGGEPGLDGDGLVAVQGTLNAKDAYLSEHGAKGEIRLTGGTVNLTGALHMDFCGNCVTDPLLLAQRSSKVSIVGSTGTFKVGLDPDLMVIDPLPPNRDLLAASPTAIFSFTADAGGVTPIIIVDNSISSEASGTANIAGAKLQLNLDAYTSASPLTLINAAAGHLSGQFDPTWTFLGHRTATVSYDPLICGTGNVCLINFQNGTGAGGELLARSTVPEPSGLLLMSLSLGLLLFSLSAEANRQTARLWRYQSAKVRA